MAREIRQALADHGHLTRDMLANELHGQVEELYPALSTLIHERSIEPAAMAFSGVDWTQAEGLFRLTQAGQDKLLNDPGIS